MAIIGTFTKTSDSFTGTIKSLTLNVKTSIRPSAKDNDKAVPEELAAMRVVHRRSLLSPMIQDKYEKIHACDAIRCNNKKNGTHRVPFFLLGL